MRLGKVIGTVVATRKVPALEGGTLLLVRGLDAEGKPTPEVVVAVDGVGAGAGEVVLWAQGSAGRQLEHTRELPVDAVIMAIVDTVELGGKVTYAK